MTFIRKESVLLIALALAVLSCFFVPPDAEYFSYIDFKTLGLLFCLMAVMCGFSSAGFFAFSADRLIKRAKTTAGIRAVLTLLCFFFSAVITNDVALITFVPFGITVMSFAGCRDKIPFTVVLMTIAANMGSCITPLGNPQNIYIYSISGMSVGRFLLTMLPYAAISLAFILVCLVIQKPLPIKYSTDEKFVLDKKRLIIYTVLFVLSLLSVLRLLNFLVVTVIVAVTLLVFDRKIFRGIDYSLLLTFVGFFIFVGNMGRLPVFRDGIELIFSGREVLGSALISQVISNVPAALLLSGFTENYKLLLIGVNIGGLGTLIASMASLISYKFLAAEMPSKKGKYLLVFTVLNFLLLTICLGLYFIIK